MYRNLVKQCHFDTGIKREKHSERISIYSYDIRISIFHKNICRNMAEKFMEKLCIYAIIRIG